MDKILKSASTVKIGKRFSNKRISLGLSLEETSKILFINEDYLNAIEKGDYSVFPSESFARAYFKKYSQYLKINADLPDIFNSHTEKKIIKKTKKLETISIAKCFIISFLGLNFLFLVDNNSVENH